MAFNKSPLAFNDCRTVLDRALGAPNGIKIRFPTRGKAVIERSRLNYARVLDRKANKEVYNQGDPMYGLSPYDALELVIPPKGAEDETVLYIKKRVADDLEIEEIK